MRVSSSAVSPVDMWQIIPKALKLVTAIESSVLLTGEQAKERRLCKDLGK